MIAVKLGTNLHIVIQPRPNQFIDWFLWFIGFLSLLVIFLKALIYFQNNFVELLKHKWILLILMLLMIFIGLICLFAVLIPLGYREEIIMTPKMLIIRYILPPLLSEQSCYQLSNISDLKITIATREGDWFSRITYPSLAFSYERGTVVIHKSILGLQKIVLSMC
jgi:hypothetical protein